MANFYATKGHLLVIEAFKRLKRKDASLVFIGSPLEGSFKWQQRYYIKLQLERWMTPRLKILKNLPRPWVVSAFQEADLFVFGSQIECSLLVIFEAMASKTPFVSTDCGNVKDYAQFGIVVHDAQAMAETIARLLDDDERRMALGEAAHDLWKQQLTWDRITDQYEHLYRQFCQEVPSTK